MQIKRVGVIGAGQMGGGIAQVCAQSGYETIVNEVNQQLLDKGLNNIKSSLAKGVEKGKLAKPDMDATLYRLKGTLNMADFKDCDLVIEAIIENLDMKKKVFADLDKICQPQAILASNTSSVSIIDMAMVTKRPDRVLGIHFMNPVPIMKLIELVKTIVTSEETLGTAVAFGKSLGKILVTAKDSPGFIANRILMPYLLQCIQLYEAGYATKEDIDQTAKLGFNHPMGGLELSDLIGLDTVSFISDSIYEETKDPRYLVPTLLRKMVKAGNYGRKTGKGFYDYNR
jgi:3-hydroxybutyryl-CoA dehydrogenase